MSLIPILERQLYDFKVNLAYILVSSRPAKTYSQKEDQRQRERGWKFSKVSDSV